MHLLGLPFYGSPLVSPPLILLCGWEPVCDREPTFIVITFPTPPLHSVTLTLSSLGHTSGPYSLLLAFLHQCCICESLYDSHSSGETSGHHGGGGFIMPVSCRCGLSYTSVASVSLHVIFHRETWHGHCCCGGWGGRYCIGLNDVSGWLKGKDKRKWTMTNVMVHFLDALHGPPISWVSPSLSPVPPTHSPCPISLSSENKLPTSLWKREGWCGWGCMLSSPECCWLSPHPLIEGRGLLLACCVWLRVLRGEGGGGGMREDEPTSTMMQLMWGLNSDIPPRLHSIWMLGDSIRK